MSDPKQDKPLPPEALIPDASGFPQAKKLKEYQELTSYNGEKDPMRVHFEIQRRLNIFN